MSVKSPVYFKQLLYLPALALFSIAFFSSCQKLTSSTTDVGDWANTSEYSGATRTQAVCFVIDNKAYVGTGYNSFQNIFLSDFYRFDEASNSWYKVASMPGPARSAACAFAAHEKGYVVGGSDGNGNFYGDVYEYDPTQGPLAGDGAPEGIWTVKSSFGGTPRYGATAFGIGDTGYVVGGYDNGLSYKKDMWKYDAVSDTWIQGPDLGNNKRQDAVSFVYNSIGYVVTGQNNNIYVNDFWAYSPATGSWAQKRKITVANDSSYDAAYGTNILRSQASIFLINDTAYLVGGNYNGVIGTTWAYDIKNDYWFQKSNFEGAYRQGGVGFTVNNHGYYGLGNNGNNPFDDIWQFFPDAALTTNNN